MFDGEDEVLGPEKPAVGTRDVGVGGKYRDPKIESLPRILARREHGLGRRNANIEGLAMAAEERLVHHQYSQLSCSLPSTSKSTFLMVFSPDG